MNVKKNDETTATEWKRTWINVYGVPLMGWDYNNFYKIGCIFGRVLSIDHSNFDRVKILIITDCLFKINCEMIIAIENHQ